MGQLCKALPTGLNDGFLCARGIQSEEDPELFSGSCKGDSDHLFVRQVKSSSYCHNVTCTALMFIVYIQVMRMIRDLGLARWQLQV